MSRVIDPEGCAVCGRDDELRLFGARYLCPDCRDDHREARKGPL